MCSHAHNNIITRSLTTILTPQFSLVPLIDTTNDITVVTPLLQFTLQYKSDRRTATSRKWQLDQLKLYECRDKVFVFGEKVEAGKGLYVFSAKCAQQLLDMVARMNW